LSLIEINIPEEDGWRDELASRVLLVVLAALLMRTGIRLWSAALQDAGLVAGVLTAVCFATGVQIAIFAVSDIDLQAHARTLTYVAIAALTAMTLALAWAGGVFPRLGSDVIAFTSYGVEVAAAGENPFAASMAPAAELPGHPDQWTLRTDGSRVVSWSYPAGSLWIYGAQFVTIGRGPIGIRLTSLLGVVALSVGMVRWLPALYAPLSPISLLAAQNEWAAAVGGLNDMWWVLPTAGALVLWAGERRTLAAAALGVACAIKQQPWMIALFLAIWVWCERDGFKDFVSTGGRYAAVGVATFGVLQLPWLAMNPSAWMRSVLVPIAGDAAPLVSHGVGIAAVNSAAGQVITRGQFELLIPVAVIGTAMVYWYWFDQLRWGAWLATPAILFWAPRSLPSYFHWTVPLAVLALFAAHGRLPIQQTGRAA